MNKILKKENTHKVINLSSALTISFYTSLLLE